MWKLIMYMYDCAIAHGKMTSRRNSLFRDVITDCCPWYFFKNYKYRTSKALYMISRTRPSRYFQRAR